VRLIIEIEAVGDELFELDIDRAVEGASTAETRASAFATLTTTLSASSFGPGAAITAAGRTITAVPSGALGRPGTCPTASGFIVSGPIAFFGTGATVALRTRWHRLLYDSLFSRFGSLLRLRSFEIFYYRFYFFWHSRFLRCG
jgi:hypothetical protein